MKIAEFKEYRLIATGGGQKLEDWAGVKLLRPDPQAIWKPAFDFRSYKGLNAVYERSADGGGRWITLRPFPSEWVIKWSYKTVNLKFKLKPMGFKHTGLFPEQAANWARIIDVIGDAMNEARDGASVLNLFAYTGGATLAALAAGASACHVDAARGMVERAGENADLSGLDRSRLRLLIDDAFKFVAREERRGRRYDAVIMDPPAFGRGPDGETWKLEENLPDLVARCARLLSDKPLFFLINSYTTGLSPAVLSNILNASMPRGTGRAESYELALPTEEDGIVLPCGASGFYRFR